MHFKKTFGLTFGLWFKFYVDILFVFIYLTFIGSPMTIRGSITPVLR